MRTVSIAVQSIGNVDIRRLGSQVMSLSRYKIKYVTYFVLPKPQNDIFNVHINIVNSCIRTVFFETFKYQTRIYL